MSSTTNQTCRIPGVFGRALVAVPALRAVELGQLKSSVAVWILYERDLCPDAL